MHISTTILETLTDRMTLLLPLNKTLYMYIYIIYIWYNIYMYIYIYIYIYIYLGVRFIYCAAFPAAYGYSHGLIRRSRSIKILDLLLIVCELKWKVTLNCVYYEYTCITFNCVYYQYTCVTLNCVHYQYTSITLNFVYHQYICINGRTSSTTSYTEVMTQA